jgi:serine beta-lactamase-like protein LACTB, mitochondrial
MTRQITSLFILIVLLLYLSSCKKRNTDVLYDRSYIDEINAARREITFYMTRNFIPGATFAVAKDGQIIYSEGMGLASKDLEVPVTRATKFRIGEVSEVFTSLIYHKMVESNMLHPDSVIQVYYPAFPEKPYKITLQNLVQHTSGIREPNYEEENWRGLNVSIKQAVENFAADTLMVAPGTYQLPGMFNYNLLGAAMEETSGLLFQTLLKNYITDTLKLEHTLVDNPFTTIQGRSDFFDLNYVAQVVHATFRDMRYRAPSEGLLSNAEDLVRFGNALLYSDYISEDIRSRLFEPIVLNGNMPARLTNGWLLFQDASGRKSYGRSGSVTGGSAALIIFPSEKLVIACASNLAGNTEDFPVFQIAGYFLTDPESVQQNQEND